MTEDELKRAMVALRDAAERARPDSTWERFPAGPRTTKHYIGPKTRDGSRLHFKVEGELADFVGLASPRMVLALLDRIAELEGE